MCTNCLMHVGGRLAKGMPCALRKRSAQTDRTIARCSALVTAPLRAFSSLGNASFAVKPGAPQAFRRGMLQTVKKKHKKFLLERVRGGFLNSNRLGGAKSVQCCLCVCVALPTCRRRKCCAPSLVMLCWSVRSCGSANLFGCQ